MYLIGNPPNIDKNTVRDKKLWYKKRKVTLKSKPTITIIKNLPLGK